MANLYNLLNYYSTINQIGELLSDVCLLVDNNGYDSDYILYKDPENNLVDIEIVINTHPNNSFSFFLQDLNVDHNAIGNIKNFINYHLHPFGVHVL